MKIFINKHRIATALMLVAIGALVFQACKEDAKTEIAPASSLSIGLTASTLTVVLDSAHASTTNALSFKWITPKYGTDLSITYTLQADSSSGSWTGPTFTTNNLDTLSFTSQALDQLALKLKMVPNVAKIIRFRLLADVTLGSTSSSAIPSVNSNIVTVTVTPYSTEPLPKFPVPAQLYLVGGATPASWTNTAAALAPSQQFTRVNSYTYEMIVPLTTGNGGMDILPVAGSWGTKYNVASAANVSGPTNTFQPSTGPGDDIPAPAAAGVYKITVDFVKATYTLTLLTSNPIPTNSLYIVGDATPDGWTGGSVATPFPQQMTQVTNGEFQTTMQLVSTGSFLFNGNATNYDDKFGAGTSPGTILNTGGAANIPGPAVSGNYLIYVNILTNTYTLTKQ